MEQAYNHHVSVMLDEVIEYANLKKNSKVLDMTLGRAGHSSEFLKRIPEGFLYGVDQDKEALTFSEERLSKIGTNFKTIDSNFAEVPEFKILILFSLIWGFHLLNLMIQKEDFHIVLMLL